MNSWKTFIAFLISCVLIFKPTEISKACGFSDEDFISAFSFFDPALSEMPEFSSLFFSYSRFYDYQWDQPDFKRADNIQEWVDYHKGKPNREDVASMVYKVSPEDLRSLKPWVEKNEGQPPVELADNTLAQFWKKKKWSVPICYLEYAKRCEPHVTFSGSEWDEPDWDKSVMEDLIAEGIERYDITPDDFIKLRYAYQVVRLAHYAGRNEDCVEMYEEMVAPLKVKSLIHDWALGHKAGALKRMGKTVEASYLYSRIFETCPSKRMRVWLSFSIQNDAEWEQLMAMCKSPAEKANLHLMRGIDPHSQALEEMEAIYKIQPDSRALDLLLAREINKLEHDLFGWDFDFEFPIKQKYNGQDKTRALAYLDQLAEFVANRSKDSKIASPEFWQLASGYLAYMAGDFNRASQIFSEASRKNPRPQWQKRIDLFQWVVQVSRLSALPQATEDRLYKQFLSMEFKSDDHQLKEKAEDFMRKRFNHLYQKSGEYGKAFLPLKDYNSLLYDPQRQVVESILLWIDEIEKRQPTSFEKFLLTQLQDHPKESLLEMKATLLLRENKWEEAIRVYEQVPASVRNNAPLFHLAADPFDAFTQDCLNCFAIDDKGPHTRLSMAVEMVKLKKEAEANPDVAADNYFLLGNACYNTTYFGNAWMGTAYFRSSSGWYFFNAKEGDWGYEEKQRLHVDMKTAEDFYSKSAAIAESAGNKELAAKATFMAAKCEQNRFYLAGLNDYENLDQKPAYRTHFKTLVESYKETAYYKQVIRECTYLSMYEYLNQ